MKEKDEIKLSMKQKRTLKNLTLMGVYHNEEHEMWDNHDKSNYIVPENWAISYKEKGKNNFVEFKDKADAANYLKQHNISANLDRAATYLADGKPISRLEYFCLEQLIDGKEIDNNKIKEMQFEQYCATNKININALCSEIEHEIFTDPKNLYKGFQVAEENKSERPWRGELYPDTEDTFHSEFFINSKENTVTIDTVRVFGNAKIKIDAVINNKHYNIETEKIIPQNKNYTGNDYDYKDYSEFLNDTIKQLAVISQGNNAGKYGVDPLLFTVVEQRFLHPENFNIDLETLIGKDKVDGLVKDSIYKSVKLIQKAKIEAEMPNEIASTNQVVNRVFNNILNKEKSKNEGMSL